MDSFSSINVKIVWNAICSSKDQYFLSPFPWFTGEVLLDSALALEWHHLLIHTQWLMHRKLFQLSEDVERVNLE